MRVYQFRHLGERTLHSQDSCAAEARILVGPAAAVNSHIGRVRYFMLR